MSSPEIITQEYLIDSQDPKKKLLILTLKMVGKIFEIKKGIPPTNL